MKILGIDYGRKKIGLAVGDTDSRLAEPLKVVRFGNLEKVFKEVSKVSKASRVSKVVVGISEGEMAKETREFGRKLEQKLKIPIEFQDETLTTHEAQKRSIEAGLKRKKRKLMEDAYSAALILQAYLDS